MQTEVRTAVAGVMVHSIWVRNIYRHNGTIRCLVNIVARAPDQRSTRVCRPFARDLHDGSAGARRSARDKLYPTYKLMDDEPPTLDGEMVRVHPKVKQLYRGMLELGLLTASRPEAGF